MKIVLMTIAAWITNQEEWQAKETSLRRLGDYIVRQVYTFDETFSRRSRDPMRCQLGRFLFPKRTFHPEMLLDFYDRFKTVQRSVPTCELCVFRGSQRRSLLAQGVDLYSPAQGRVPATSGLCRPGGTSERSRGDDGDSPSVPLVRAAWRRHHCTACPAKGFAGDRRPGFYTFRPDPQSRGQVAPIAGRVETPNSGTRFG